MRGQQLNTGTPAPDFTLHATPDQTVSLTDFRGHPVVLASYPADWSPVCGDQMALYNEVLPEFRRHKATLLADFEPKGAVARSYGAYRAKEGVAERALFVLDDKGTIHWSYLSPGADGILDALESLTAATRAA